VWEPEGWTQLLKPRHRKVYNIKMNLNEIRWRSVDWTDMALDRNKWRNFGKLVMILRVPKNEVEFLVWLRSY
jgi:hypothetical protein